MQLNDEFKVFSNEEEELTLLELGLGDGSKLMVQQQLTQQIKGRPSTVHEEDNYIEQIQNLMLQVKQLELMNQQQLEELQSYRSSDMYARKQDIINIIKLSNKEIEQLNQQLNSKEDEILELKRCIHDYQQKEVKMNENAQYLRTNKQQLLQFIAKQEEEFMRMEEIKSELEIDIRDHQKIMVEAQQEVSQMNIQIDRLQSMLNMKENIIKIYENKQRLQDDQYKQIQHQIKVKKQLELSQIVTLQEQIKILTDGQQEYSHKYTTTLKQSTDQLGVIRQQDQIIKDLNEKCNQQYLQLQQQVGSTQMK